MPSIASGCASFGRRNGERGRARGAVDGGIHIFIVVAARVDRALERGEGDALCILRPVARAGEAFRMFLDRLGERLRLRAVVDQAPVLGAVGAHALGGGAEEIGQVAPHFALVGDAREPAGARQHAQQRHLGQAHRGGTVVDHQDLVAGEGDLVAAAGAGAVHRGEEFEPVVAAGVLHAVARLVGEFAEIHLPAVARLAQHVDVGAGAEHALARRGQHHAAHLGVLEADAVQRIVELDVDAEVVGVELEFIAGLQPFVLVHVHRQRGGRAVYAHAPMGVAIGMRFECDDGRGRGLGHGCLHGFSWFSLELYEGPRKGRALPFPPCSPRAPLSRTVAK